MTSIKKIFNRYKHAIPMLAYMVVYLVWFAWLEKRSVKNSWLIHFAADDYIPFCEAFVIPYLLWFGYVAVVVIYLFFKDKAEYYKACVFLATGMTLFLIISTLWPNGHNLRLATMPRENFCTGLVAMLWKTDTPTNLWPSIHVYNSLGAHFAITHCQRLMNSRHGKLIKIGSGILAFSIVLSTMFIKQHSVFDVFTGLALGAIMYALVYKRELLFAGKAQKNKGKRTPQVD